MKILIVLTSHAELGDTGRKTGFWLEELAAPYYELLDAGATLTLASPKGGRPPLDPKSDVPDAQTEATERFKKDAAAQAALDGTKRLVDVSSEPFDGVFYPGGHGPMWDLADDATSIDLIQSFATEDKPIAVVCHAPAALVNVKTPAGEPLVAKKRVTGFSNEEEEGVELKDVVPFLLEDRLKELGGEYSRGPAWKPYVVVDGNLISGQNPGSSGPVAEALLTALGGSGSVG